MKNDNGNLLKAPVIRLVFMALFFLDSQGFCFGHSIGGYAQELPFVSALSGDSSSVRGDNLLQIRLNSQWNPWSSLSIEASGRMQWYAGGDFKEAAAIAPQLAADSSYLGLGWAQGSISARSVLYENIDRLSAELTKGKFTATVGRQRINWGANLVWNPNDWFNAFNYLDFAYPERPGADALRLQYYTTATSVAEVALQAGKTQANRTFAAMYKFNKWDYDWQFQAGLSGEDFAAGFSWSGAVKGGGFRGELSWYDPAIDVNESDKRAIVASVSGDYTFPNSLYFQISTLYNGFGAMDSAVFSLITNGRVTAKSLIPEKYALYGETAYQLTPLIRPDFAVSVNPVDGSFYLLPSITMSLLDNLDLLALEQYYCGKKSGGNGNSDRMDVITLSLKWSF